MGSPTFVQDEREIVHAYKRISAERVRAEAEAAAALKQAETEAATTRKTAEAAAEYERNVAHKRAEKEITLARNYLAKTKDALQKIMFPVSRMEVRPRTAKSIDTNADHDELARRVEVSHTASEEVEIAIARRLEYPHIAVAYAILGFVVGGGAGAAITAIFSPNDAPLAGLLCGPLAGAAMWLIYASKRDGKIQEMYDTLSRAVSSAESCYTRITASTTAIYEKALAAARTASQEQVEAARTEHQRRTALDTQTDQNAVAQLHETINGYTARADATAAPWSASAWQTWTPPTDFQPQNRVGTLQTDTTQRAFAWPAFMSFPDTSPLLVKATGISRDVSVHGIQSLLTRLLATIPPGKLRLTFLDPVGLGQNAAPFMQLADHDEELVTSRAWSEMPHIEQRLVDLTEHISNVIQKYLRNQYQTIEEYNEMAGEIAEPYRVLVVFDFPTNFSDAAARRLVSIAQNGPRCGVYTIVLADTDKPMPHGFMLDDLAQVSEVITAKDGHFVWEDDDFRSCMLTLDTPPEGALFDRIVNTVGEAAKTASRVEVPFRRIAPARHEWWRQTSEANLHVPLGPSGARRVQELALGQGTGIHALIAGKTGSGKSTLLHTIITGSALVYSPDELELYLIDFKQGVEFKTYATNALPHARVIAIESEREFGLSVLQGLDDEFKHRGDLIRAVGGGSLGSYRKENPTKRMPRILLLVDEFQEFFTEDDQIATQAGLILDRLVRQGRSAGIHVLLGSQTLAGAYSLARSTIDQMAVRIALQCSEADSRLILSDDNPAARLLSRPGEAIYNAANGMIEGNNRFQVAWLPDDERDTYLQQIRAMADEQHYTPPQPQIVFEGNKPAEIEKNRPLTDLLHAEEQPAPSRATLAWLGEPIAIRDPVAASFRRQSGSNLLIIGQDDEAALGMIATSLVSLAAQLPVLRRATPQVAMLDFGAVDGPYAELLETLMQRLPQTVAHGRRRHLPEMIGALATEVQRRLDNDDQSAPESYLVLYGLHRARDLRQEDGGGFNFSPYSEEPPAPNPAQQFATILREGPDVGVHTIVWCDTMTNLNRTLDRRTLREFAMRVAFQMSAEDSANLVDSPAANKLGHHRALFYDEDAGRMEKFRPYAVPATDWFVSASQQIAARTDLTAV